MLGVPLVNSVYVRTCADGRELQNKATVRNSGLLR